MSAFKRDLDYSQNPLFPKYLCVEKNRLIISCKDQAFEAKSDCARGSGAVT